MTNQKNQLYIQLYSPFGRIKIKYKHSQTRTHNKNTQNILSKNTPWKQLVVTHTNGMLLTRQQTQRVKTGRQRALVTSIWDVSHKFCQQVHSTVFNSWLQHQQKYRYTYDINDTFNSYIYFPVLFELSGYPPKWNLLTHFLQAKLAYWCQ